MDDPGYEPLPPTPHWLQDQGPADGSGQPLFPSAPLAPAPFADPGDPMRAPADLPRWPADDERPVADNEQTVADGERPVADDEQTVAEGERTVADDAWPRPDTAPPRATPSSFTATDLPLPPVEPPPFPADAGRTAGPPTPGPPTPLPPTAESPAPPPAPFPQPPAGFGAPQADAGPQSSGRAGLPGQDPAQSDPWLAMPIQPFPPSPSFAPPATAPGAGPAPGVAPTLDHPHAGSRSAPAPGSAIGHGPAGPVRPAPPPVNEPWRTAEPARRGVRPRSLIIATAVVAALGLTAAGIMVLLNDGDDPTVASVRPARPAGSVFPADPSAASDGVDQEINGVAVSGSTVVAVGGEAGQNGYRGQFLVSTDNGRSFRLGPVRTATDEEPPRKEKPRLIANSANGWVALGDRLGGTVLWTSPDGLSWRRERSAMSAVFGLKDRINRLVSTDSGFVAVGENSAKGDFSDPKPVLWTSSDGRRWDRRADGRLQIDADGGYLSLVNVMAKGSTTIVHGVRTNPTGKPQPRNLAWRSTDNGRTWTGARIPAPKGTAGLTISAGPNGFLAAREITRGKPHAAIFQSADGNGWVKVTELRASGYRGIRRLSVSPHGLTAMISAGKGTTIMSSADGRTWRPNGAIPASGEQNLSDATLAGDQVVVVGRQADGSDSNALLMTRSGQSRWTPVDLRRVPGAVQPDLAARALTAVGARTVAVGSSNGDAAVWTSGDGGAWSRAEGAAGAFTRDGKQQLTGVTAGGGGWLAIGVDTAQPARPVVVTSVDGRSWQTADNTDIFEPRGGRALLPYATTAGSAGYVIVGEDGETAAVWHSSDLRTWRRGTGASRDDLGDGKAKRWMHDVVAGPSGYVAVGGLIDPSIRNAPARRPGVWTSSDGRQWTFRQLPLPGGVAEGTLLRVAAKGDVLVAAGVTRTEQGERPIGYLSADGGRNWQPTTLPADGQPEGTDLKVGNAVATPQGFLVTGESGRVGSADVVLWASADGRTWNLSRTKGAGLAGRGDQEISGLVMYQNELLGVGETADHKGSQPTLWRTPASF